MKTKHYILTMLTVFGMPLAANSLPTNGKTTTQNFPARVSKTVPFFEGFDNQTAFDAFKVIDSNNDGSTWIWRSDDNSYARCNGHSTNATDDWLLTPFIRLEANHTYIFSFKYWKGFYPERIAVAFGMGDDPTQYTVINEGIDIPDTDDNVFTQEVTATATGDYRFGIHGITPTDRRRFYIAVDSISVKEGSQIIAPDSVTQFSVTAGEKGQRWATIAMRTPTIDAAGNQLDNLTKIEVLRNDTLVHTFNSPALGEDLNARIEGGKNGINVFTAVAYNNKGVGRKASKETYIGIDTPLPPTGIRLIDNGKTYTAKWNQAGSVGVHGGYVDPSQVTYNVYNVVEEVLASDISETEFLNDDATPYAVVGVTQYFVSAMNKAGTSVKGASNYLCTGKPNRLPFVESFEKGKLSNENLWWWQFDTQKNWRCTTSLAYDGDGGCLRFQGEQTGDEGWLSTGKIAIQNVAAPHLTFAYYATPGVNNKIEVIASKMQNDDVVIGTIDFSKLTGEKGWRKAILPIEGMNNIEFIVLRFRAIVNDINEDVIIDAVDLKDRKATDLASSIFSPEAAHVNTPAPFTVKVSNEGTRAVTDYNVELYCNDKLVEQQKGKTINPTEEQNYTFNYIGSVTDADELYFRSVVNCTSDEYMGNNTSRSHPVTLVRNDHFDNTTLSGSISDNDVVLSWTAIQQAAVKTETFDTYKPWLINHIGPWKVIDGDKAYTYGIKGIVFQHYADPMAYIVFNPQEAGVNLEENQMIAPHSGSQFLGCFASDPEVAPEGHNNDWLISPQLNGNAQTVTIWAKSLFANDEKGNSLKEHFEVMASTSDNDTASFTSRLADFNEVPDAWTEYTVSVPAGTKYFALHTISADKFLLMLDDITYSPKLMTLKGFNVYRDGTLLTFVPAGTLGYTDKGSANADHKYQLTVVYEEGESGLSNAYTITTGISEENVSEVSIIAGEGNIVVRGAAGQRVRIVDADGRTFYNGIADSVVSVPVHNGVYIVKTDGQTRKVVVK